MNEVANYILLLKGYKNYIPYLVKRTMYWVFLTWPKLPHLLENSNTQGYEMDHHSSATEKSIASYLMHVVAAETYTDILCTYM